MKVSKDTNIKGMEGDVPRTFAVADVPEVSGSLAAVAEIPLLEFQELTDPWIMPESSDGDVSMTSISVMKCHTDWDHHHPVSTEVFRDVPSPSVSIPPECARQTWKKGQFMVNPAVFEAIVQWGGERPQVDVFASRIHHCCEDDWDAKDNVFTHTWEESLLWIHLPHS